MEVWTGHVIDGHIVTAVKIFEQDHANATYPSDVWIRDHVCTSQYMLQTDVVQLTEHLTSIREYCTQSTD